jgi:hypothetical protein
MITPELRQFLPPAPVGFIRAPHEYDRRVAVEAPERIPVGNPYRDRANSELVDLIGLASGIALAATDQTIHDTLTRHHARGGALLGHALKIISGIDGVTHDRLVIPSAAAVRKIADQHDRVGATAESGRFMDRVHALTQFTLREARNAAYGPLREEGANAYARASAAIGEAFEADAANTDPGITEAYEWEIGEILINGGRELGRSPNEDGSSLQQRLASISDVLAAPISVPGGRINLGMLAPALLDVMGEEVGPEAAGLLGVRDYTYGEGRELLGQIGVKVPSGFGEWSTQAAQMAAAVTAAATEPKG